MKAEVVSARHTSFIRCRRLTDNLSPCKTKAATRVLALLTTRSTIEIVESDRGNATPRFSLVVLFIALTMAEVFDDIVQRRKLAAEIRAKAQIILTNQRVAEEHAAARRRALRRQLQRDYPSKAEDDITLQPQPMDRVNTGALQTESGCGGWCASDMNEDSILLMGTALGDPDGWCTPECDEQPPFPYNYELEDQQNKQEPDLLVEFVMESAQAFSDLVSTGTFRH